MKTLDDGSIWCGEGEPSEYGAMGEWLATEDIAMQGLFESPEEAEGEQIDAFLDHLVGTPPDENKHLRRCRIAAGVIRISGGAVALPWSPEDPTMPNANANGHRPPEPEPDLALLTITWGDQIEAQAVTWLWSQRIPYGKVTIFEGDPEQGKSTVALDMAARVSAGGVMPDGDPMIEPQRVLIASAEDDAADTLKPRLMAAGADVSRIAFHQLRRDPDTGKVIPLTIPDDVAKLQRVIEKHDIRVVIIDPISAFLSEDIHSHNDASVRRALSPLNLMAAETGAAIVTLRHLNKDTSKSAIGRGGGSIAFSANARAVWVFAPHPDNPEIHLMARVKNNLAQRDLCPSLGYRIVSADTAVGSQPKIAWEAGTYMLSADDLLRRDDRKKAPGRSAAAEFLADVLADGPMPAKALKALAKTAEVSWRSIERAKEMQEIDVRTDRITDEKGRTIEWRWRLA